MKRKSIARQCASETSCLHQRIKEGNANVRVSARVCCNFKPATNFFVIET